MQADELLKKIRVLEEGQAQLKREIGKRMPERRGAHPAARRRASRPLLAQRSSSSRRLVARGRLSDRYCHWILQSLGQAVHIIAPDGKLLYWNRYAEHMYGYSEAEAVGQNAVELIVHPTDFDAAKIVIQNIFMGKGWRGKFPVKNKSGERFFISVHNTPLYDDDGSLVGLICLSLDVRTLEEIFSPSGSAKSYPTTSSICHHHRQWHQPSDVFSYGVVLWELVTQKVPWDTLNTMQVIGAVGFMDHRLEIPSDTDPEWASMIESCWHSDPQCRPSFQELLERLQRLQKQYAVQVQTQRKAAGKGAGRVSVQDS